MRRTLVCTVLTSLALWSCGGSEAPQDAPPVATAAVDEAAAVRQVAESWDAAVNAEDIAGVMALYTSSPARLNAGEPALFGVEATRARFEAGFTEFDSEVHNPVDQVEVVGNWAFSRGTYVDKTTAESGEVTEDRGKWTAILNKTPTGWKNHIDIWNHDAPVAGVASSDGITDRGQLPGEVVPSGADQEAVLAHAMAWDVANNAQDIEALLGLYAGDAIRMPADEPTTHGKEALRTAFETGWADQEPNGAGPVLGLEVGGDWAYAWGTWTDRPTVKATGEVLDLSGKWLNLFRRAGAGWELYLEIWNRDAPL